MRRLLCCLLLVVLSAGCGNHSRSVLYAGIEPEMGGRVVISDAQARAARQTELAQWRAALATRAAQTPRQRFTNLPRGVFLARLRAAAARDAFTIKAVRFYQPRQFAPYVRVQTRRYLRLSRAIPGIERSFDPHRGKTDLTGYAYEGFYFEADDERGIPFVIVSNLTRGQVEGSQFARSEELYPFAHG